MIAYLTSNIGGIQWQPEKITPTALDPSNGLVDGLKENWKEPAKILMVSSDPYGVEMNDGMKELYRAAFQMSDLPVGEISICDCRREKLADHLSNYDIIILCGGHVPTQNAFFRKIRLREKLNGFEGVVIGISAGTMNSAETVYAQPEQDGESVDETYERFLPGLGITKLMVIPHYQETKDLMLDGKRLFEDITYPDSIGREFYALVDGSYLKIELEPGQEKRTMLYGEAYRIKDGKICQICKAGEKIIVVEKSDKVV